MTAAEEVVWHEVECGRYTADLALWSALAAESAGPVLELGCGTGRIALNLAGEGLAVTGIDRSPSLVAELRRRADESGLAVEAVIGDVRSLALERRFATVIAPMQLVHLLGGRPGRARMLAGVAESLDPGDVFAAALLAGELSAAGGDQAGALPDVAERQGWIYSSLPVEVLAREGALEVRRLRQIVSPEGELREELDAIRLEQLDADGFEVEAREHGLIPRERIEVPATADHVGSVVCVLEAG
jgi:SAM-dependent methyltransferase